MWYASHQIDLKMDKRRYICISNAAALIVIFRVLSRASLQTEGEWTGVPVEDSFYDVHKVVRRFIKCFDSVGHIFFRFGAYI